MGEGSKKDAYYFMMPADLSTVVLKKVEVLAAGGMS